MRIDPVATTSFSYSISLVADDHTARSGNGPLAANDLDALVREPTPPGRSRPSRRHLVAMPEHPISRERRRDRLRGAGDARVQRKGLGRPQQRLGRHAGVVRALAADELALDERDGNVRVEAPQGRSERLARRSSSEDDDAAFTASERVGQEVDRFLDHVDQRIHREEGRRRDDQADDDRSSSAISRGGDPPPRPPRERAAGTSSARVRGSSRSRPP